MASPRDPSPREFGPVVTLGDKIYWDVYPGSVSGQVFDTLALPSDWACSLVAQRADGLSPVVAFSADGTAASGADGFRFWRCPVDVTDAELGDLFAIPDPDRNDGRLRLRCQITFQAEDASEIFRAHFISLFRLNIDPSAE